MKVLPLQGLAVGASAPEPDASPGSRPVTGDASVLFFPREAGNATPTMAYPCRACGRLFTAVRHLDHETGPDCGPDVLAILEARLAKARSGR